MSQKTNTSQNNNLFINTSKLNCNVSNTWHSMSNQHCVQVLEPDEVLLF